MVCFTSPGHAGPQTPARSLDGSPTCCGCPGRGPGLPGARVTARSGRRTPPAGPASRESLAWRSRDTWWQRQGWESGPGSANPGDLKPHCAQGRSPLPLTVEPSARATEEEAKGHTQGCLPQRARVSAENGDDGPGEWPGHPHGSLVHDGRPQLRGPPLASPGPVCNTRMPGREGLKKEELSAVPHLLKI